MWTLTISPEYVQLFKTGTIGSFLRINSNLGFSALLAGFEIIRRAIWNIFRLENEQISNAEQFRAVNVIGSNLFCILNV